MPRVRHDKWNKKEDSDGIRIREEGIRQIECMFCHEIVLNNYNPNSDKRLHLHDAAIYDEQMGCPENPNKDLVADDLAHNYDPKYGRTTRRSPDAEGKTNGRRDDEGRTSKSGTSEWDKKHTTSESPNTPSQ